MSLFRQPLHPRESARRTDGFQRGGVRRVLEISPASAGPCGHFSMSDLNCPLPRRESERILLAHGEGGRLMRRLIRDLLLPQLDNVALRSLSDGAVLPALNGPLVLSTDSYVVSPLFFPGGDIGKLAVHGT